MMMGYDGSGFIKPSKPPSGLGLLKTWLALYCGAYFEKKGIILPAVYSTWY